jgi:putative PIN family toxin of toxin-antitoxin system
LPVSLFVTMTEIRKDFLLDQGRLVLALILVDSFAFLADVVEPDAAADMSLRDPTDQQVLGTLLVSKADYLITGDKDLLTLAENYLS